MAARHVEGDKSKTDLKKTRIENQAKIHPS